MANGIVIRKVSNGYMVEGPAPENKILVAMDKKSLMTILVEIIKPEEEGLEK